MTIPGFTSTVSKRPEALFGTTDGVPTRMARAAGCRLWDTDGREYVDLVMALGAVALGYAHPAVVRAVTEAVRAGGVGSLAPALEARLAERLTALLPGAESVRFFKTGAEAVAGAVRIARVATGRERVLTCGYQGWLDWCQDTAGVPPAVRAMRYTVPFNDVAALQAAVESFGPVAAIVIEPVVDAAPEPAWLEAARQLARRTGAVLIFDEIKTAFRIAEGGVAARYGVTPDLMVVGKALGNGLPIAAVCGGRALMEAAARTWISSTLATELVGLAAAEAVLDVFATESVVQHLARVGERFHRGLVALAAARPELIQEVRGVSQMCYLAFRDEGVSGRIARGLAARGVLFKRTAYNFVSLAHDEAVIDSVLDRLGAALDEVAAPC